MAKDLTNSRLDRQNILISEIKILFFHLCKRIIIVGNSRMR